MRTVYVTRPASAWATNLCLLFSALVILGSVPVGAQTVPSAPSPSQVTPRDIIPKSDPALPSVLLPQAEQETVPDNVADLEFSPSVIMVEGAFPELVELIEKARAELPTRITVSQLYAFAAYVETTHAQRGYLFVRAGIPPQDLGDGLPARIAVVDGYIEEIVLPASSPQIHNGLRRALSKLVGRRGVNIRDVERALVLAGEGPGITLRSALAPGDEEGGTKLILEADYRPLFALLTLDNLQSSAFGTDQLTVQAGLNSFLGLGEQLYIFASTDLQTPGLVFGDDFLRRVIGGGATIPLIGAGRLSLDATLSETRPRGGFFRTEGRFVRASARYSYPVIRSRSRRLDAAVQIERGTEDLFSPDFGVALVDDEITTTRLTLTGQQDFGDLRANASLILSQGLGGSVSSRLAATSDFTKLEGVFWVSRVLFADIEARATFRGQKRLAGGLPNSEAVVLDGPDAVAAFTAGTLVADEAVIGRIDLRRNFTLGNLLTLTPEAFFARAEASNIVPTPFDVRVAQAVGVGLSAFSGPRLIPGLTATLRHAWGSVNSGSWDSRTFFVLSFAF